LPTKRRATLVSFVTTEHNDAELSPTNPPQTIDNNQVLSPFDRASEENGAHRPAEVDEFIGKKLTNIDSVP
jgi:hypothetical protein